MSLMKGTSPSSTTSYLPWSDKFLNNVLIISGVINAHTSKGGNNKFCIHNSPKRNGIYLPDFFLFEKSIACQKTKLKTKQNETKGNLRTYTCFNNSKAQLNYTFISSKRVSSALNCEAYFFLNEYLLKESTQMQIRDKQQKLHNITSSHSRIVILKIKIR